jgi:lauroyl/myristoyl acyltransferase
LTRRIAPSDLLLLATLPLLALVALLVPQSRWPGTLRFLSRCKPLSAAVVRERGPRIERALGVEPAAARRIVLGFRSARLEERLHVLKERSPAGFHPDLRLEGEEHLRAALARGRGAVLWVTNAAIASLLVKKALHARGYRLHHLSRPSHGFSMTRFGMRWLNPMRTDVEERYLAERVVMTEGTTVAAMRRLRRALERGEPVSITAGDWGRITWPVPFFGGRVRLATGPVTLATRAGAPLLPVFMERSEGAFVVTIEAALPAAGDGEDDVETTLAEYARRLERWVRVNPELWNGWYSFD